MAIINTRPLIERFCEKYTIDAGSGCWVWTGAQDGHGYGQIRAGLKRNGDAGPRKAHRVSYELFVGPIPDGLHIDHLCRNRACVNPGHLEPVTNAENARRGDGGSNNRSKTHCVAGHPYAGENLRFVGRGRVCATCRREANRRYRARKKVAA